MTKTFIITGGAGFLGFHFTKILLRNGYSVILVDINEKHIKKASIIKNKYKNKLKIFKLDITKEEEVIKFYNKILISNTKISGLINNASINSQITKKSNLFNNFSEQEWNNEINVSLKGSFFMTKHLINHLVNNKNGKIINISSDMGIIAPNQNIYKKSYHKPVVYSVSKHGLIGFTKYLASTYGKNGITCNSLSPGGIFNNQDSNFVNKNKKLNPIGRMAKLSDLEEPILFLISEKNKYLNGANIVVDGGRTIW